MPAASVLAVVLFALPLLASTPPASASNLKTRVWDFFEDRTLCTDGERDLSQQSSLGKTASNASDCGGRNLFYNRFRYYDPACGRYISRDPLLSGFNFYRYGPNTTGWIDPWGLTDGVCGKDELPEKVKRQIEGAGLPQGGATPFRPKLVRNKKGELIIDKQKPIHAPSPWNTKKGFVDEEGRIWLKDKPHAGYPEHWDVQIDEGKDKFRVGMDGNPVVKASTE